MSAAGGGDLLAIVAIIIGIGVLSQVLAARFQVPSVLFLIASGILLGPVLGLVTQDSFGGALSTIVGLSVAIIIFEGAFHLRVGDLREAPAATLRLVTIGAVIALVATAAVVRFALPSVGWPVAFLIGALLVATGPTVVTPILQVVPVRDRVGTALETEGIVNDVTAAILAIVIFEAVVNPGLGGAELLGLFAERLGIGILIGVLVAGVLFYALKYVDLSPGNAPQSARLLVLAGAIVAYGGANTLRAEAGIAAVATAGILLGNVDIPYEEEITNFKGDVTLVVLSFVFIALAALLDFGALIDLGIGGVVVVLAVALVIRPLLVFVSARGDKFTRGEKLFMSFVGPRGIIPASVATLFAIQLAETYNRPDAAAALVGTVFLVILATVVFEAGLAKQIAEYLDVIPMRVIVVGGGKVGRALADRLENRGENVVLIEENQATVETARNAGHTVIHGDGTDTEVLESAGADNAKIVAAATGDDDANLLVSQLAQSKFAPETVIARVNDPTNVEAFEELGVRTISSVMATAQAMDNYIERPALSNWMGELGRSGDVQEIEVTSEEMIGKTVGEVGPEFPDNCLIALIARNGDVEVPDADFTLQEGDRITLIGHRDSVQDAMMFCHPDP